MTRFLPRYIKSVGMHQTNEAAVLHARKTAAAYLSAREIWSLSWLLKHLPRQHPDVSNVPRWLIRCVLRPVLFRVSGRRSNLTPIDQNCEHGESLRRWANRSVSGSPISPLWEIWKFSCYDSRNSSTGGARADAFRSDTALELNGKTAVLNHAVVLVGV